MNKKPNKWLAAILSLIAPPVGMLYVSQLAWAAIYLFAGLALAMLAFVYARQLFFGSVVLVLGFQVVCAVHAYRLAGRYPADAPRLHYSRWYGLIAAYAALFVFMFGFRSFVFEPFSIPSAAMRPSLEVGARILVQKWGYGHYGAYGILPFQRPISVEMRRGEVYVFDYPENPSVQYVKRLIGMPGDKIEYRNKQLTINGQPVAQRKDGTYSGAQSAVFGVERLDRFEESIDGRTYSVVLNDDIKRDFSRDISFPQKELCVYKADTVSCEVPPGHYYFMGDNRDNSRDSRYWGFVPASSIVGHVLFVFE